MTEQFHAGQEVAVSLPTGDAYDAPMSTARGWFRAKIVIAMTHKDDPKNDRYEVQFHDGTRAVFDEEHIRADTTLRVSSNDPMGTRPMTKDEARDYKADLAQAHDEALQAEGKP